jgi:MerR family redox-sensitive transcriptional activator SoxR
MLIGEVARRSGVATTTLRYYEHAGLIPPPARSSKRRLYEPRVLGRIRIIRRARDAGFSIAETRTFLTGYPTAAIPSMRWRKLAEGKIQELDGVIKRAVQMKALLKSSFRCGCLRIEDCEQIIRDNSRAATASGDRPPNRKSRIRSSRRP